MLAADAGNPAVASQLIDAGANVNARNQLGNSALMLAAQRGDAAMAETLLEAGADTRMRNNRREMATDIADAAGHPDIA